MIIRVISMRELLKALTVFAVMAFALAIQFRVQLSTGFNLLYGDSFDATIVATILEHWSNVFSGSSNWHTLNYFYPHAKTLGQTDGYFLAGIIYTFLKVFGLDPFFTSELTNVVIRAIGFCFFLLFARKACGISLWYAVLGAVLFVLSNNLTAHGQRLQLATVSFVPVMAMLLYWAFQKLYLDSKLGFALIASLAGMFLGAWSITCFYITWFFIYFFVAFVFCLAISCTRAQLVEFWSRIKFHWMGVVFCSVVCIGSLVPLLSVYLVKASETGMRAFSDSFSNAATIEGILQVGRENLMFGELYSKFLGVISPSYLPSGEYYNTGIAPILFVLAAAGAVCVFRSAGVLKGIPLWQALVLATIITWLGVMRFGPVSAWYIVYHLFPGAKALNVINAYQLLLSVPIILIAIKYLCACGKKLPAAIILLLTVLLVAEEINTGYTQLVRKTEYAKVDGLQNPPSQCTAFYVSGWVGQDSMTPMAVWINNYYGHNVSAMLIAELIHMPTLNGVASFNPKDWNFGFPNNEDYDRRVKAYTDNYALTQVCKLDLNAKTWSLAW
jgi:hypothetical protein